MSRHHLSQFVNMQREEGEFADSGSFTLSAEKAIEKLAAYSLEDPCEWVLKMVQASVLAGARQCHVKLSREAIQVELYLPEALDFEGLIETLLDPGRSQTPLQRELCVGLRTLLNSSAFLMVSEEGEFFGWDGEENRRGTGAPPTNGCRLLVVGSTQMHYRAGLVRVEQAKVSAHYHKLLTTRASYAPLDLYLDGRLITGHALNMLDRLPKTARFSKWAPLLSVVGQIGPDLVRTEAEQSVFRDALRSYETFLKLNHPASRQPGLDLYVAFKDRKRRTEAEDGEGLSYLLDRVDREVESQPFYLQATRFGVVAHVSEGYSSSLGGIFTYDDSEGKSDLTGLRLSPEPQPGLLKPYLPCLADLAAAITRHPSRTNWKETSVQEVTQGAVVGGVAGAIMGLFAFKLVAIPALAGLMAPICAAQELFSIEKDTERRRRVMAAAVNNFARWVESEG